MLDVAGSGVAEDAFFGNDKTMTGAGSRSKSPCMGLPAVDAGSDFVLASMEIQVLGIQMNGSEESTCGRR
jgi:hypothetical protein